MNIGSSDGFAMKVWGNGAFYLDMDADTDAVTDTDGDADADAPGAAFAISGQEFTFTKARIDASIALSYGSEGAGFNMEIAARGSVPWPCHSFMQLDGSLELSFGPAINFGKLILGLTVQCQDPEAYASESIYIIEVFEDPEKKAAEVVHTYNEDYAYFTANKTAEPDDEPAEVVRSCSMSNHTTTVKSKEGVAKHFVRDSFWGASNVQAAVYTRFEAVMELKKAQDHLAARENVAGFQLCSAKITRVINDKDEQDLNGDKGIKFHPRKAWELVGSLDEPMTFASGGFKVSNLLFNVKAYDRPGARQPVVQKQDIFPAMDLKYFNIEGDITATANVDIKADAALSAATSMLATRAALGQHGFSLAASATLNATMSYYDDVDYDSAEVDASTVTSETTVEFAWNLSVMLELSVVTDAVALHMRAAYNKPCRATGAAASGTLRLTVPGVIEIEHAAASGTLYCQGTEPRVEAYVSIGSMLLADTLELEKVRLDLRSVTPEGGGGSDLQSLDWNINVSGTMRFDKLLSKLPSVSSAGAVLEVDAKLAVIAGSAVLKAIIVHFVIDVTHQGPSPAGRPMLKAFGRADVNYPCDTGAQVHANLTVDLNFGAVNVAPVLADFLYYCGDRPATKTVYEIDVNMTEPFNVMNMFELTSAHAHVDAYKYPTGGNWFTAGGGNICS